ncbi:MAG: hypothetical protein EP338_09410 [Bacteroidetes bacterium]|nr:MAG: hypothetical protein EP338_09410 [Bacteroidota bacterium]
MKQLLFHFPILCLFLYACQTEPQSQEKQVTPTPDNDCLFDIEQIGKGADKGSSVEFIGLFENIENTGEHSYGYAISLWMIDQQILGFLSIYSGSMEPDRQGPVIRGQIHQDSLSFVAWTKMNKGTGGWEGSEVQLFSFTGKKGTKKLSGQLSFFHCDKKEAEKMENLELPLSDLWDFKSFPNLSAWKDEYAYRLAY